ncbi:MAG: amidase [Actinobacteria bacterium]|nr:amidase [Actinomycetota bacterium]
MAALHDLTAVEQADAIRRRELSPVELTEHYLARSERLSDTVGAFITQTPELAREQARAAEQAVLDARDVSELPALHGVVVPVKDLNFVAGVRCTLGSVSYDLVPFGDDNVVIRLKQSNVVITGKTNTPEFGLPCYTENAVAPPARTPWDLTRSAGGSSGGAAAAVAAGLAPIAHGSDGGGSIRIPASVCGLVGIKPSRGRISNGPLRDPVGDLVNSGPIARTVRDAAALLDAMAGSFAGDPYAAAPLPNGETFLSHAEREPGRLRIGRYITPPVTDAVIDPDCIAAYEHATALLEALGHYVEDVAPPFTPDAVGSFESLWSTLALLTPVAPVDEQRLQPLTQWLRSRGAATTGIEIATAVSMLRLISRAAMASTSHLDAVLTPTLAQPPALVGGLRNDDDPFEDFEAQKRFTPFTAPYNATGQPAMSLPLHWSDSGLPIGVQLVGRSGDEATLISLAAQIERAEPWAHRTPELW